MTQNRRFFNENFLYGEANCKPFIAQKGTKNSKHYDWCLRCKDCDNEEDVKLCALRVGYATNIVPKQGYCRLYARLC